MTIEGKYRPRRLKLKRHDEGSDHYGKVARLAAERWVGTRRKKKRKGKK